MVKGKTMKVFLTKDIEHIGLSGEIVKVKEGFAQNYLFPRKLAVEITKANQLHFKNRERVVEHRKDVIESKSSMLAEKIKSTTITLKRKTHDDGKLYGSINPQEIADGLNEKGISISKSQVLFGKSIKSTGTYEVTIKLSAKLQPTVSVKVAAI